MNDLHTPGINDANTRGIFYMSSTNNYQLTLNQLFNGYVPSGEVGALYYLLQSQVLFDTTDAIDAVNPYNDVLQEIKLAMSQDSPFRRQVLQLLETRSAGDFNQGAR